MVKFANSIRLFCHLCPPHTLHGNTIGTSSAEPISFSGTDRANKNKCGILVYYMLDFQFEDILNRVKQRQVVPIIGEDMFVHTTAEGEEESLQEFVVCKFLSMEGVLAKPVDDKLKQRAISEGYHGLTLLYNHSIFKDYSQKRTLFDTILEKIVYDEIANIHLAHEALSLLQTAQSNELFPLIITTSPFDIIERDLGYDIQDSTLPNRNPKLAKNSIYFSLGDSNLEPIKDPCVYHLFGCAADRTSVWASDERKMVNFLHELHVTPDRFPLKQTIADKTLFVMGCSLPNWMFRFLLFPLNSERGFWLDDSILPANADTSQVDRLGKTQLDEYLDDLNYIKGNTEEIIIRLRKALDCLPVSNPESAPEDTLYDYFVSHTTDDMDFAQTIVNKLRKDGCSVWVDYEHEDELIGDDWNKIKDALARSRHIIPLITAKYIQRFITLFCMPQNATIPNSMEWITLVLLEQTRPSLLTGTLEAKLSDTFIIPILKSGEVIRKNIVLTNGYVQGLIVNGSIPSQFSFHRYIYYPEGLEPTGNNNYLNQNWKKLGTEGETLFEKGMTIDDLLTITDELKEQL